MATIAIVLAGLNLRPGVVGVSPLLVQIQAALGLSALGAALLTTLPVLCFALLGPVAPRLAIRWGVDRIITGALLVLVVGSVFRLYPSLLALFVGTGLVGISIALNNILLPGIIKRDSGTRVGLVTGVYTMSIVGGASLAAGMTIPLQAATGIDWKFALCGCGLFAVIALIVWLPKAVGAGRTAPVVRRSSLSLARDPVAWYVTLFFGLPALNFFTMTAWLPSMLISHGMKPVEAGAMLSLMNIFGLLPALVVPIIAVKFSRLSLVAVGLTAVYAVALLGLMVAPNAAQLWAPMLGAAQGSALGLSVTFIVLRSPDSSQTARLSAMAQSWGFLIAAAGPVLFGALYDSSNSWTPSMVGLVVVLLLQGIVGYLAGVARVIRNPEV